MSRRILYLGLDPTHYQAHGEVTHWPIIKIIPRPLTDPSVKNAFVHFDQYTHVIVTSKSTVMLLNDYLPRFGISLDAWRSKITLAVGQITASHLLKCGIQPHKIATLETAEGIIQELEHMSLRDAHLFWPHSSKARPVIEEYLVSRSLRYTSCPLYDTITQIPDTLPDLAAFDEIIFTSPSTVDAFLEVFKTFPQHAKLIAIGPITDHYLDCLISQNGSKCC